MDLGECDAAIIDLNQWRDYRSNGQTHHCNTKARLPDVVVTVPCTIVVRDALNRALSWALRTEVEAGRYAPLLAEAQRNYTSGICREARLTGRKLKLSISDLGGPLLFLIFVAVCSLIINQIIAALERHKKKLEAAYHDGTLRTSAIDAAHHLNHAATSSVQLTATARPRVAVDVEVDALETRSNV